jgi:hypothetical protein
MDDGLQLLLYLGLGVLVLVVGIGVRLLVGRMDRDRVRSYLEARGGQLLSAAWAPFGKGWFGDKSDRIYEVRYLDRDGNLHEATCKTNLFSGVYFTEDHIVQYGQRPAAPPPLINPRLAELEEENRRLREELKRPRDRHA